MTWKTSSLTGRWPLLLLAACGGGDVMGPVPAVCHASVQPLSLAVAGDAGVDPGPASGCVLIAANASATDSAEYLIVPQAATTSPDFHSSFKVAGGVPFTASVVAATAQLQAAPPSPAQGFHDRLRLMEETGAFPMPAGIAAPSAAAPAVSAAVSQDTLNNQRTFKVLSSLTNAQQFQSVVATALSVGSHIALYVDDNAPSGGLSQAELDGLREVFDTLLYAADTAAFGRESDIDGNGKVIVLMTGVVNSMVTASQCISSGYVAGFFFGADIDPAFRTSWNNGEIFYSVAADPGATLSCQHSTSQVNRVIPVTFIHEFQHMISYNQHVLVRRTGAEQLWLNEGMSHYAEELGGRYFLAANDSARFCNHVRGDLYNLGLYLQNPGTYGLVILQGLGSLAERGAEWSFVRFLVDQFAADTSTAAANVITRQIDQTSLQGTNNVVSVTQTQFETLAHRWVLANWVSDLSDSLPGFTAPATMQYKHWKFRRDYPKLYARCTAFGPAATFPSAFPLYAPAAAPSGINVKGTMIAGSAGTYQRALQAPSAAQFTLLFSDSTGAQLSSTVAPRLNVIRIR